jgi:hypothetical protein
MVTMRSSTGMNPDSTLRKVVLPVPVPPEMMMLALASTAALRNPKPASLQLPNRMRSSTWNGSRENLRTVSSGPFSASGRITALTREPSASLASHSGWRSSMRRPTVRTMNWMTLSSWSSSVNLMLVSTTLPPIST